MKAETLDEIESEATQRNSTKKLNDAVRLANEAIRELGSDAKDTTVQKLEELKQTLEEANGKELLYRAGRKVDDEVHSHPYVAMGLAASAVAVAALALGITLGSVCPRGD